MFVILITFSDTLVTYTPKVSDLDWTAPAGECRAGWEAQMFDGRLDWRYKMFRTRNFSFVAAIVGAALLCAPSAIAGTLDVHVGARYVGDYGLEIIVDDLSPTYVQDNTPADEVRYRARFYVRLTPLAMAATDEFDLFTAFALDTTPVLRLTVYNDGTDHLLRFVVREDGGGDTTPGAGIVLANGWRTIEIDWQASTAPGADDGFLDVWVDGHPQTGLAALDNDTMDIDNVRWGAIDLIDAGTNGSFFLDAFESRRAGYIGLDPVFSDVPAGHLFQNRILAIYNAGVTAGCGGGNYCPDASSTRGQMAVFVLKSIEGPDYRPPECITPTFGDVPCSHLFADWIEEFSLRGITAGCGGGNYCPDSPVSRGQMAVFLLKGLEGASYRPPECTVPTFGDVPCSYIFADWIEEFFLRGITAGCGGGNYCPDASSTRGQMAVFLSKTFLLPVPVF